MGVIQSIYESYNGYEYLAGQLDMTIKEPLCPKSHTIVKAVIEITLDKDGTFIRAVEIKDPKDKNEPSPTITIIPCTIESFNRTGNIAPHPLCDSLQYVSPNQGAYHKPFLEQLERWEKSEFTHPVLSSVLAYVKSGTIIDDLIQSGIVDVTKKPLESHKYYKRCLRWRIRSSDPTAIEECWRNNELFNLFSEYYNFLLGEEAEKSSIDVCMVSGNVDFISRKHPQGVINSFAKGKLVSSNDNIEYTFKGRFEEAAQAFNLGYDASQKIHSLLSFLSSNDGVYTGETMYLCWNPSGKKISADVISALPMEPTTNYNQYKSKLLNTVSGYKEGLADEDEIMIATFIQPTKDNGRVAISYYNEQKADDLFESITHWYESAAFPTLYGTLFSPTIHRIIKNAYGVEVAGKIQVSPGIVKKHFPHLIQCLIRRVPVPEHFIHMLSRNASRPLAYADDVWKEILHTACAMIRKSRNDKEGKEVWKMTLKENMQSPGRNSDRSYLFGRLLAVLEVAERATYKEGTDKMPNAIRLMDSYSQRPFKTWSILEKKANPYNAKLGSQLTEYYWKIKSEIVHLLSEYDDDTLGQPLEDTYLLGYYQQRRDLYTKKTKKEKKEDESTEQ